MQANTPVIMPALALSLIHIYPPPELFKKAVSGGERRLLGRWGEALAAEKLRDMRCV